MSATIANAGLQGSARTRHYMGGLWTFHTTGKDTNGQFALMEVQARRGLEPPPHMHTKEDEQLYLIEGELLVDIGGQEHVVRAGGSMYLPKNIPHWFKILSEKARFLVCIAPAGLDEMFFELSKPAPAAELPPMPSGPPPPEFIQRIKALQEKHGIIGMDNTKIKAS